MRCKDADKKQNKTQSKIKVATPNAGAAGATTTTANTPIDDANNKHNHAQTTLDIKIATDQPSPNDKEQQLQQAEGQKNQIDDDIDELLYNQMKQKQNVFRMKSPTTDELEQNQERIDSYKINLEHGKSPREVSGVVTEVAAQRSGADLTTNSVPNAYDASDLALDESQKRYDLHKTDWQGQLKHKRNKAQTPKHNKETKDLIKKQHETNQVPKITDVDARDSTRFIDMKEKDDTYWGSQDVPPSFPTSSAAVVQNGSSSNNSSESDELDSMDSCVDDTRVNTFKHIVRKPDQPIHLCIFDFENVLCTNMDNIEDRTAEDVVNCDLTKLLLAFGGVDRLEDIHWHMCHKIMNNETKRSCFVMTEELSDTVAKVLERVDLDQYFSSVVDVGGGVKKHLSHVMGCDHKITQFARGKRHLILMKLIELMKRDPDSVLYIGHDKEIISHLSSIDMCHTYLVQTKGMIHRDLVALAKNFFSTNEVPVETQNTVK